MLNFSGWYDDNYGPEGATTNFAGLLKARASESDPQTHLLIGPWVHGVASTAKTKSGEREFGTAAAIDYDEVVLRWMDHYLRDLPNGLEKEKTVRYFVMGDDNWHEADAWPPASTAATYYLQSPKPGETRGVLSVGKPNEKKAFASFLSDPEKPIVNPYSSSGAHDYKTLAERSDVLTFDSDPLDRDTEVTGPIRAQIYLACDCRDTDLWVRLLDAAPRRNDAFNLMSPGLDVLASQLSRSEKRAAGGADAQAGI